MLTLLTTKNRADSALIDAVNLSNFPLVQVSFFTKSAYFFDIFISKFRLVVIFSYKILVKAKSYGVLFIASTVYPLKVLDNIVSSIAVFMINLFKSLGIRYISLSDKPMNKWMFVFAISFNHHDKISLADWLRFHPTTLRLSSAIHSITPYFSIFRNRIQTFISFNVFHSISPLTDARLVSRRPREGTRLLSPHHSILSSKLYIYNLMIKLC